ncbi:MAG: hypothetical protein JSS03_06470 [Proteobacteria bacterium]|nr:hypothetical protein [Pseudomonadota bacterium]
MTKGAVEQSDGRGTLSEQDVQKIAAGVLGVDSDKLGVSRVHVVDSFEKLPEEVRKAAEAEGVTAGDVDGIHYKGHSYILADRMRSPADVQAAVFHEHYTHGGLRAKYGNALGSKLRVLLHGVGGVDGVMRMADKQHIDLSEYVKAKDPPHVLMEELMAHMSKTTGCGKLPHPDANQPADDTPRFSRAPRNADAVELARCTHTASILPSSRKLATRTGRLCLTRAHSRPITLDPSPDGRGKTSGMQRQCCFGSGP